MKAYVYQLFYVYDRDVEGPRGQLDIECGFFTSLPLVRDYIAKDPLDGEGDSIDNYDCYRHPLNPEAPYQPKLVKIFKK